VTANGNSLRTPIKLIKGIAAGDIAHLETPNAVQILVEQEADFSLSRRTLPGPATSTPSEIR